MVAAGALVLKVFQSTHPRGVRQPHRYATRSLPWFQSTHPRGVRRTYSTGGWQTTRFQSTHPRGVRLQKSNARLTGFGFQSTHPRGVRQLSIAQIKYEYYVSIHAPAGGATSTDWPMPRPGLRFNPRTRGGCDEDAIVGSFLDIVFQSTHPRGVRLHPVLGNHLLGKVSIHAPAGGATDPVDASGGPIRCFNPRTRGGCDGLPPYASHAVSSFNPRTRGGCDSVEA